MTEKRNNRYKIILQEIELKDGTNPKKSIEFEFKNHDNIFNLLELTKNSGRFETESENIEFMIGLKLFSEVMLRNRKHPLFEELNPAFRQFMQKLKSNSL